MYHVMARGDRREAIVRDDGDRFTFLRTLGEACRRTGFRVHAYVLMTNHYHLLLETPQPNLALGMGWLQNAYTRRINTRHRLWGHVFGGRYKSILVEPGNCFRALMEYIHLNPVRAGMIKEADGFERYRWSSVGNYVSAARARPEWLETKLGFSVIRCEDSPRGRREYLEVLADRVDWKNPTKAGEVYQEGQGKPDLAVHSALRRGWFFGSQRFRERLLKLASGKFRERAGKKSDGYHGEDVRDHNERTARKVLQGGLKYFRTTIAELREAPKSDLKKSLLAELIQAETTMKLDWIRRELEMGSRSWCCNQIHRTRALLGENRGLRETKEELKKTIKYD